MWWVLLFREVLACLTWMPLCLWASWQSIIPGRTALLRLEHPPFPAPWGAPRSSGCNRVLLLLHRAHFYSCTAWRFGGPNASDSLSVMLLPMDHAFSRWKEGVVLPFGLPECPSSSPVGTGPLCKMLREFLLREHQ